MSNFICSECGMTNIDCGRAVYKTPKEIELEKRLEVSEKEHYKALKKLAIAINALENVEVQSQRDWDEYDCMMCAKKARKEMEEVK